MVAGHFRPKHRHGLDSSKAEQVPLLERLCSNASSDVHWMSIVKPIFAVAVPLNSTWHARRWVAQTGLAWLGVGYVSLVPAPKFSSSSLCCFFLFPSLFPLNLSFFLNLKHLSSLRLSFLHTAFSDLPFNQEKHCQDDGSKLAFLPSFLPIYLSIHPSIYPSIHLSIYLSIDLSMSIYVYLCLSMPIYVYLCLSMSIYIHLCLSMSTYFYLFLSTSIYFYLYLLIYV